MVQGQIDQMRQEYTIDAFKASFGGFDLLWFGLAIFTAFKIGVNGAQENVAEADAGPPADSDGAS